MKGEEAQIRHSHRARGGCSALAIHLKSAEGRKNPVNGHHGGGRNKALELSSPATEKAYQKSRELEEPQQVRAGEGRPNLVR